MMPLISPDMQPLTSSPLLWAIPGGRGRLRNVSPNLPVGLRGRAASVPDFLQIFLTYSDRIAA